MLGWLRRFVADVMAHCERCGDRMVTINGLDYCARCEPDFLAYLERVLSCH